MIVAFFTVTRSSDYDYLLGSIEHHARMGCHLVLDTTPEEDHPRKFRLPSTVRWVHEPIYGSGWQNFKFRTACQRALELAKEFHPDVLVSLDSDDFYTSESKELLFPHGLNAMVEIQYIHWRKDGNAYLFGESEWHRKLWPAWSSVEIGLNMAWQQHPKYNGNPEHHPLAYEVPGLETIRILGPFRHHVHYAVGPNSDKEETAQETISGWDHGHRVPSIPWPPKLALWRDKGIPPSSHFL